MGDAVGPVGEFLVGALAAVADQRGVIAEALGDHLVGEALVQLHVVAVGEGLGQAVPRDRGDGSPRILRFAIPARFLP